MLFGHIGLKIDQPSIAGIQVRGGVIKLRTRFHVFRRGKQGHGQRLALLPIPEQASEQGAEQIVGQATRKGIQRVRQDLVRLHGKAHRQGHQQQGGKADQPATTAKDGEHAVQKAQKRDAQNQQQGRAGGQPRQADGDSAQGNTAQHFIVAVAARAAGLVNDGNAGGAHGRNDTNVIVTKEAAQNNDRQQHTDGLAQSAEKIVAIQELF